MYRVLGMLALAFSLAGCASTGLTSPGTTATVTTKVDARIAAVSASLARQCTLLAIAIEAGGMFTKSAKVQKALAAAEAGRAQFCAEPPTDTNTAIASVARMAVAVNVALAQR